MKLPTEVTGVSYLCDNCDHKFKSSQELPFHAMTMYQNVICNSVSSSHKKGQIGYDELTSLQVKDVADRLTDRVVANIAKSTGTNKIVGKKVTPVHS